MLKYIDRLYIKGGSSAVGRRLNKILGSIIAPIFITLGIIAESFCTSGSATGILPESVPEPSCEAAYVVEVNTGTVIYEKNSQEKKYPASTTKLMTALLAAEYIESGQGSLDDEITFSREAVFGIDRTSTHIAIDVGEKLTVRQVLYAMLLQSANEACLGMAEYVSGSIAGFVEKMNERAQQLGMTGTNFVTTNGLHDENHYSTAKDLSILMGEVIKHGFLREIMSAPTYEIPPTNKNNKERTLINTNKLVIQSNENYNSKVVCGKTGFTTPAGNVLVTYSEYEGMGIITVLMKAGQGTIFKDTSAIVEHCVGNFELVKIENILDFAKAVPSESGSTQIMLSPVDSFYILARIGDDYEEYNRSYDIPETISLPVEKGEEFGTLTIYNGETAVGKVDMVSKLSYGYETAPATTASTSAGTTAEKTDGQTGKLNKVFGLVLKILLIVLLLALIFTLIYVGIIIVSVFTYNKRRKREMQGTGRKSADRESGEADDRQKIRIGSNKNEE
jgi:D-alanyl-D-alanine carboxypeptidase